MPPSVDIQKQKKTSAKMPPAFPIETAPFHVFLVNSPAMVAHFATQAEKDKQITSAMRGILIENDVQRVKLLVQLYRPDVMPVFLLRKIFGKHFQFANLEIII